MSSTRLNSYEITAAQQITILGDFGTQKNNDSLSVKQMWAFGAAVDLLFFLLYL